jgi:hypothetical protein
LKSSNSVVCKSSYRDCTDCDERPKWLKTNTEIRQACVVASALNNGMLDGATDKIR